VRRKRRFDACLLGDCPGNLKTGFEICYLAPGWEGDF
jgi:hypothetical protein